MNKLPHTRKHWTSKELAAACGVKIDAFKLWVKKGAPKSAPGKGYDAVEFFKWVATQPVKRKESLVIREKAEQALNQLQHKPVKTIDTAPQQENSLVNLPHAKQEPGLVAALDRARTAEVAAYENHLAIQKNQGIISASALDAWQKTLDILRKCEKDFTDVLKTRKELVETAKVQEWLESNIEQTKTILLNLPAKLAPSLESLPWHEIQKRLTQEIRDAINKLENFS